MRAKRQEELGTVQREVASPTSCPSLSASHTASHTVLTARLAHDSTHEVYAWACIDQLP